MTSFLFAFRESSKNLVGGPKAQTRRCFDFQRAAHGRKNPENQILGPGARALGGERQHWAQNRE